MQAVKIFFMLIAVVLLGACSAEQTEEFAFRKTMEYQLIERCGEDDEACIAAVEAQIKTCMAQSDWRKYVRNDEDEAELNRFIRAFFPCFKDADGNPYFQVGS